MNMTTSNEITALFDQWNEALISGDAADWDKDIGPILTSLGEEGWELVAIEPRSGYADETKSGFTSEDLWVFKRPKP